MVREREYEMVPEPAAKAQAQQRRETRELSWQVETVMEADARLAFQLEKNRDNPEALLSAFISQAQGNRRLIQALVNWQGDFPSPFIQVRNHLSADQFSKFAESLNKVSEVDITEFDNGYNAGASESLPWPIRNIEQSDQVTASELKLCESTAERQRLLERFVHWVGTNPDIYRALSAWDRQLYKSPFKAITGVLTQTENQQFARLILDITGRDLI